MPEARELGTVLVVDDEADLRDLLAFKLRESGFVVEAVGTAKAGLEAASRLRPIVTVLDLMLPDLPGTDVCRRLRADPATRDLAILMLTAKSEEMDRVIGLELGADDYVVKPFSVRELVARVRALARRAGEKRAAPVATGGVRRWHGIELDETAHRAFVDGGEVELTPLEFKLLGVLLAAPGRAFSRERLLDDVWNVTADVTTRTVDTHVKRLREKLGARGDLIETVRGVGYRLKSE